MNTPKMTRGLTSVLVAAGLAASLLAASAAGAEPSAEPSVDPGIAEPTATEVPAAEAPATPFPMAADTYPLPDLVGDPSDLPTVSLEPESEPGWNVAEPRPYEFGHCGILSPVDIDGSLWEPVSGTGSNGGPIESDEDVGQLINATAGDLMLTTEDNATFVSQTGLRIEFVRAEGPLDYFLCM